MLKKQLIEFSEDMKVIDIDEKINKNFKTKLNKTSLYADYSNHFSEEGLIFITEIIKEYLNENM